MRPGADAPAVSPDADFGTVMQEMSAKGLGATLVVDADRKVIGIFTDGDLRRLLTAGTDVRPLRAADLMHPNPRSIRPDALAADAARLMEDYRISSLPVTNPDGTLAGALNTHDLMRAKVI